MVSKGSSPGSRGSVENRRFTRVRARLRVVFDHDPRLRAFTINLSRGGLCISSDYVTAPGTELGGAVVLPDGERANFEAMVAWARKVRALDDTNKMGLDFVIPPGENYYEMIEEAFDARTATHSVSRAVRERRATQSVTSSSPKVEGRGVELPPDPTGKFEIESANAAAARLTSESTAVEPVPATLAPAQPAQLAPAQLPPVRAAPELLRATPVVELAPVVWSVDPTGLQERINAVVKKDDLAARGTKLGCGLAPSVAADWIERASIRALIDVLPPGVTTAGASLQLRVSHHPPLEVDSRATTTAKVVQVSEDGRVLTFEARVEGGGRVLAEARMARAVVDR